MYRLFYSAHYKEAVSYTHLTESLTATFKKALNNDNLNIKVEKLKDASVSSMITLSEQDRRMQDMMKMYGMSGMDPAMFGSTGQKMCIRDSSTYSVFMHVCEAWQLLLSLQIYSNNQLQMV